MKVRILNLALISSIALLSGCAFGTRTAELSYPPEENGGGLIQSAQAQGTELHRSKIVALSVTDERSERNRIGNVRNGFGMDTADVVTKDDIRGWVDDALTKELESAGYEVVRSDEAGASKDVIGLQAEILKVYCDVYFTYDGEVALMVTLDSEDSDTVKKQFEGEGGVGLNWAATGDSYAESLALALQDVIAKLLAEVAAYQ